jgi:hypothetical protein
VAAQKRKRLKPGEQLALLLTLAQVDLIVSHTCISENLLAVLYAAKVYDNEVRVRCTLDILDQLASHVATEAKTAKDKNLRQKLNAIVAVMISVEQRYYGVPLRLVAID